MHDIMFHAMCTHHSCPFTTTDQALMAAILNATAVKTSAHKCFWCGGFDHLVDRCPFPQTASLQMVEVVKKGMLARQTVKSGPSKPTSPMQLDKWFYNGREGCNNFQLDRCMFPHCKWAQVCHNCKQEHPASWCSLGDSVTTTSQSLSQVPSESSRPSLV